MASDMEKLKALIDVYVTDIETAREALAIALHGQFPLHTLIIESNTQTAYHANQARLLRPSDGEVVRWVLPGHGFRAPAPVSINSDASRHRGSHGMLAQTLNQQILDANIAGSRDIIHEEATNLIKSTHARSTHRA
jgi:hypothetical protein